MTTATATTPKMPESILDWEIALTLWFQSQGDWLIGPMNFLTITGGPLFFLFVLPIVYWSVNRRFGLRLALALMITLTLNSLLKTFFHAPRPYWYNSDVRLLGGSETGFGLASGHAQSSVVLWGMIAATVNRWWAWVVAAAIIVGVGLSRVYIGVHFTTDVLVGWLVGALTLAIFLASENAVTLWFDRFSAGKQIAIVFAISLGIIAVGWSIVGGLFAGWSLPSAWVDNVARAGGALPDGMSLQDTVTTSALLFGFAAGGFWLRSRGNFRADGPIKYRILRYLVGVFGVGIIYLGLKLVFDPLADDESTLGLVLRYIRYSAVGLWVIGGAPLVCLRLGWAEPEEVSG